MGFEGIGLRTFFLIESILDSSGVGSVRVYGIESSKTTVSVFSAMNRSGSPGSGKLSSSYVGVETMKKTMGKWTVLLSMLVTMACSTMVVAQADIGIFTDRFNAPDGWAINAAPYWTLAYTYPAGYPSNEIILDNCGVFEHSDLTWTFTAIRADMVFDPIVPDGLRYQFTVKKMDDMGSSIALNGTARLCLASERGWIANWWGRQSGEKFSLEGTWNRDASTIDFALRIVNNKDIPPDSDMGVIVWSVSEGLVDMDDGGMFDLAMELRDNAAGDDVRAGYRVFRPSTGSWSDWVYSDWFDPTDGDASLGLAAADSDFLSDWKDRWEKNTYFYIEAYSPKSRSARVFVDDTIVIEINKPRSCAELWLYSPQAALTGDLDQDCDVDMSDFLGLLDVWLMCNDPVGIGNGCVATW